MVQLNGLAMAFAIGSANAVPHLKNFPSFNLPLNLSLSDIENLTTLLTALPYVPASSTSNVPAIPTNPGYGGGAESSSTTVSAPNTVSTPTSIVSSGGPKTSIPVGTGTSPITTSTTISTKTGVTVNPVTGTTTASSPVTSSVRSGTSPVVSLPVPSGTTSVRTTRVRTKTSTVRTSPVQSGTSPVRTSPIGSATAPAGYTTKKTRTGKKTTTVTSKPSASASKPASSGVSSARPYTSSRVSGSVSSSKPPSTTGSSARPTVSTSSGNVVGYSAPNTTNVWQYLGIKFGQAPVGDLRFAPPVAYTGTDLINGSTFGDNCACTNLNVPFGLDPRLSSLFNALAQTNASLSEDCLYVNVWAKEGSKGKPVLVWIYGGGFNFGGSNSAAYNGRYFADQEDVVFASFNYRTNIMGFSGAPNTTQNVGLLDQRLALEWIRDNIAAFGGDPSRITIFGQSAGGASVDLYTFSYYNDPIIAGAIPMSGTANSFGSRTASQALVNWDNTTTSLGCGNSTNTPAETVLACMRGSNITWEHIQDVSKGKPGLNSLLGGFGPTIDETIVFSNYTDRVLNGYVAKVPVLTGNCNYESGLLSLIAIGAGESYPQSTWDYIDLQVFTCPVSRLARYRADIGIPSWRYSYDAAWPNLVLPTANLTQAWHTSEVPILFNVADEITITPNTANETEFGNYIRGVWADFAADPINALSQKYGWPEYGSGLMIDLGKNNETTASFSNASAIEVGCTF